MGGVGSGRAANPATRLPVADCLSLRISKLREAGFLRGQRAAGLLTWHDQHGAQVASINVTVEQPSQGNPVVRLWYCVQADGQERNIPQSVQLTSTRLYSGGWRWWFACPMCHRRAGVLHLPPGGGHFACRKCHDLTYRSHWRHS